MARKPRRVKAAGKGDPGGPAAKEEGGEVPWARLRSTLLSIVEARGPEKTC